MCDPVTASMLAVSAGSSIIGGMAQDSAADKAAKASQYATDQGIAMQREALARSTAANAPYAGAGLSALDAIMAQYGLGGGAAGSPDWGAYVAQNPDVQAIQDIIDGKAQGDEGQLNFLQGFRNSGQTNLGQYHYDVAGRQFGRALPTVAGTPYVPPSQQMVRPDPGPLNIGLDRYEKSPDYTYQQTEGAKTVNANYGAKGLLQSGAAMKALQEFGQNLALGDYSQWRNYTTGQYNTDRNVLNTNFDNDRTFAANREDNTTNNLFRVLTTGQNSANNTATGALNYATNAGNLLTGNAAQIGQSAVDKGAAFATAANDIAGTAQSVLKGYGTSYGGGGGWMAGDPSYHGLGVQITPAKTVPNALYR